MHAAMMRPLRWMAALPSLTNVLVNAYMPLFSTQFGTPGVNDSYDYVVIGGGNAGLTIAKRLFEDGKATVAIVEAGTFYQFQGNQTDIPAYSGNFDAMTPSLARSYPTIDWGYVTTPQEGLDRQEFHYSRGKTLGGCTAINGQVYHRSTAGAYKMWADAVNDSTYEFPNFLPYYVKSTNLSLPVNELRPANASVPHPPADSYSTEGPLHLSYDVYVNAWNSWVKLALNESGLQIPNDFQTGVLDGVQYVPGAINPDSRTRETSQTSFLHYSTDPASTNPKVYLDTLARRILFDSNKTAVAVEVETAGVTYNINATKEIIVSAGTFNSPQLLMVSGVGPASVLEDLDVDVIADRPGVGQNMWDQPLFGLSSEVNVETLVGVANNPGRRARAIEQYVTNRTGPLTQYPTLLAFERLPNRTAVLGTAASELDALFPTDWPDVEYVSLQGSLAFAPGNFPDSNIGGIAISLMSTFSRGNVTITSDSTSDPPVINPNWLSDPVDRKLAVASFRRARTFFNAPHMSNVLIGAVAPLDATVETDEQILEYISKAFFTIWHASSTCAMGKRSDPMAVVDSQAKVIGVSGLRVVDASAFPFLPPGHPMSTVYALAEKIADDIKNRR